MPAPLAGLRIADLSTRLSGAFAARLFGDFGADVLLVEPREGHPLRSLPPFAGDTPGAERSVAHAYFHWNKRSAVCADETEVRAAIAGADVVVTTSDAPDPERAETLAALAPDAVHLSITPHGLTDPLTGTPGNNLTMSARVGWASINGVAGEPPLQMPRDQAGVVGGVAGFITACAALRRRHAGDAELVDVSELEAFALTVHPWGVAAVYQGAGTRQSLQPGGARAASPRERSPGGGRKRGDPGPLWDLADGQMNFGLADFHNWTEAMDAMNLPELGRRPELIPDIGRHSQPMKDVVVGMAHTLPKIERWPLFHKLAQLRCVIGVVQDMDDITKNEQLKAREFFVTTELDGKRVRAPGAPAKLSPSPWQLAKPAPSLAPGALSEGVREGLPLAGEAKPQWVNVPPPELAKAPVDAGSLADGPLAGVRVLSFGQAWSGTFGTELLALLGADVVQIASLHRPDAFRRIRNTVPKGVEHPTRLQHAANTQGHYNSVNLHKREITLDLRQDRGREILWQLLPKFDIVADNFRPGVLPSWGITLDKLHRLRPGMIWASISGYGESGPYRDYPANGATTEPMAGLSSLHGYEGEVPMEESPDGVPRQRGPAMNTGGLFPDPVGGYFLVATIMAALAHRDRTGEAQRVDLSMMESVAAVVGDALIEYDATGRKPGPRGNHHPRIAPHAVYPAADGEWLALAVETEAAWRAFVAHTGEPRLGGPQFAAEALRKANESELDEIIAGWGQGQDAFTAEHELGQLGLCAARVTPLYEIYSRPDPHFAESGFVSQIDHPEAGPTWLPGRPWRFSAAPSTPIRGAPCVGEHSREVLADELGIDDSTYEELVAAGITGTLDEAPKHGY